MCVCVVVDPHIPIIIISTNEGGSEAEVAALQISGTA